MYSAAAAWLMTELTTDPLIVSLVQVATSLPMFLFALTAGAMTDIVDKRRYLIGVEIAILVVASIFATLVTLDLVTAPLLLAFMFVVATGSAFDAPAWQAIVPMLVPREDLQSAVAVNSVGVNISRAIGPALSGVVTAALGLAAPFWLDAFSNLATIGALAWWRPSSPRARRLPAERLASAIRVGVRYARNNPPLRATLVRANASRSPRWCWGSTSWWGRPARSPEAPAPSPRPRTACRFVCSDAARMDRCRRRASIPS